MRIAVKRFVLFLSLFFAATVVAPRAACAQDRRPLLESLLRGILEEQVERANRDRPSAGADVRAANPGRAGEAFRAFERDVESLAESLRRVSRQSNAASKLYDEAVRLRATASRAALLSQAANNGNALRTLAETVDRDWRNLEFRLKEAFVVNQSLQNHIDTLTRDVKRISGLFAVRPQFSQADAKRELQAFSETIGHIVEDIDVELRFTNNRNDISLEASRVRQLAKYITVLMENETSSEEMVREFNSLNRQWRSLAVKLRKLEDRHLERDLHRAEKSLSEVRRLLRIPQTLDGAELAQLTQRLMSDTEHLFDSITLNRLIELRSPQLILPAASEFYGLCEVFQQSLDDELRRDNLVDSFRALDNSWRGLRNRFSEVRDRQILRSLDDVNQSVDSLRLMLGAPKRENRYDSQEATSSLTVLSRHLETDVVRRVSASQQYSSSFRRSLQQELSQFTADAARMNEQAVRGGNRTQMAREAQTLAERWSRLQMSLAKLQPRDRPGVNLIASRISEELLKLGVR